MQSYELERGLVESPVAAAATAATTAAAEATAAAATTATGAIFAGTSFVDVEGSATEVGVVERLNGCVGLTGVRHFDERESTGTTSFAIHNHRDVRDFTVGLEGFTNVLLGSAERKVSYKELHASGPALWFESKVTIRADQHSEHSRVAGVRTDLRLIQQSRPTCRFAYLRGR